MDYFSGDQTWATRQSGTEVNDELRKGVVIKTIFRSGNAIPTFQFKKSASKFNSRTMNVFPQ